MLSATVFSSFKHLLPNSTLTVLIVIFILIAAFVLIHQVSKYFEYDSDGVKVVVINRGLLLSEYLNYREHKLEFDKDRLTGFKFKDYIFYKSLTLYIKSSNGGTKKETFNVTLVSKRKRRYIRQSLSKMAKNNIKTNTDS